MSLKIKLYKLFKKHDYNFEIQQEEINQKEYKKYIAKMYYNNRKRKEEIEYLNKTLKLIKDNGYPIEKYNMMDKTKYKKVYEYIKNKIDKHKSYITKCNNLIDEYKYLIKFYSRDDRKNYKSLYNKLIEKNKVILKNREDNQEAINGIIKSGDVVNMVSFISSFKKYDIFITEDEFDELRKNFNDIGILKRGGKEVKISESNIDDINLSVKRVVVLYFKKKDTIGGGFHYNMDIMDDTSILNDALCGTSLYKYLTKEDGRDILTLLDFDIYRKEDYYYDDKIEEDKTRRTEKLKDFELQNDIMFGVEIKRVLKKQGDYFNYINMTDKDLSRYQIFNEEQLLDPINRELINTHCLIHTLRLNGIEESILMNITDDFLKQEEDIKTVNIRSFTYTNLIKLRKYIKDRDIILTCSRDKKYDKNTIIEHRSDVLTNRKLTLEEARKNNPVEICYYMEHYFINDPEIKSFKFITDSMRKGKFKDNNITFNRINEDKYYLDNIENEQELLKQELKEPEIMERKTKQQIIRYKKSINEYDETYYCDTETYVYTGKHELFIITYISKSNDKVKLIDVNTYSNVSDDTYSKEQIAVYKFLDDITGYGEKDIVLCYFHNLRYDYTILEKYLKNLSNICQKDNNVYSLTCYHKKTCIEFRDSYRLISRPLKELPNALGFSKECNKKEAINYEFYKEEHYYNPVVSVSDYKKGLSNDDKIIFDSINSKNKKQFNCMEYMYEYACYDVIVLKKAILKLDGLFIEAMGKYKTVDLKDSLTISSLTNKFVIKNEGFKDIYSLKGNIKKYCSKAVWGGRTAVNINSKNKLLDELIKALDGVSLYPSAICRIADEGGFSTGKGVIMTEDDFKIFDSFHYCIMTVIITKINKKQDMPMISKRVEGESIDYVNEIDKPLEVVIDKITLQDWIKFHDVEYEIKEGIKWNNKINNTMLGEINTELFKSKLKYKQEGEDVLESTIKLILNSIYGKCGEKPCYKQYKYIDADKFEDYYFKNSYNIIKYTYVNDRKVKVLENTNDNSFNMAHIASHILSMSRRIMNEVFSCVNDIRNHIKYGIDENPNNDKYLFNEKKNKYMLDKKYNMRIHYTDTDSMYLTSSGIPYLEELYEKTYNRKLCGDNLGQFNADFKVVINGKKLKCEENVLSFKSIFCDKKSYYCRLKGIIKNDIFNEKTNEKLYSKGQEVKSDYYKLKGITDAGIKNKVKQSYNNKIISLYKSIANGDEVEFKLNPYDEETGDRKVMFDFNDCDVYTREYNSFVRVVNKKS